MFRMLVHGRMSDKRPNIPVGNDGSCEIWISGCLDCDRDILCTSIDMSSRSMLIFRFDVLFEMSARAVQER